MRAFFDYFLTLLGGGEKPFPSPSLRAAWRAGRTALRAGAPLVRPVRGGHGSRLPHSGRTNESANCESEPGKAGSEGHMQETLRLPEKDVNETERAARDGGEQATPIRRRARALLLTASAQQKQHSRSEASARSAVSVGAATTPPRDGRKTAPASISGCATSTHACRRQPSRCRFRKLHRQRDAPAASRCASVALSTLMLCVRLAGAVQQCEERIPRDESAGARFRAKKPEPRSCAT